MDLRCHTSVPDTALSRCGGRHWHVLVSVVIATELQGFRSRSRSRTDSAPGRRRQKVSPIVTLPGWTATFGRGDNASAILVPGATDRRHEAHEEPLTAVLSTESIGRRHRDFGCFKGRPCHFSLSQFAISLACCRREVVDEEPTPKQNASSGAHQEDPRARLEDLCRTAVYEAQQVSRRGVAGFLEVTG